MDGWSLTCGHALIAWLPTSHPCLQAIAQGDGAKAGRLMLSRSREHRCTDPAAFEEGMRQLVAKARPVTRFGMPLPGAFALNKLRIGEVLLEVTSLVRTHRVKVSARCPALTLTASRAWSLRRWSPTSPTS